MAEGVGEGVEDHDHIWENGIDNDFVAIASSAPWSLQLDRMTLQ